MEDDWQICHIISHLACFHGRNWILGGQLLKNQTIVDIGLKLVDACFNTYASTVTKIGPEVFGFISKINGHPPNGMDDGSFTKDPITPANIAFNNKHGFYIFNGGSDYILRPEVLESNFYAWRVTGDTKYLDNAQSTIDSYLKFLVVPGGKGGVSGLLDMNNATVPPENHVDETESFMFAEWIYLTFDDPEHISLDEYVFNTECHPLKSPPLIGLFGSKPTSTQLAWSHGIVCVLITQARRMEASSTSSTRSRAIASRKTEQARTDQETVVAEELLWMWGFVSAPEMESNGGAGNWCLQLEPGTVVTGLEGIEALNLRAQVTAKCIRPVISLNRLI
ncbi:glycoside hydrolase family 47 protein [Ramaria rubella]|nr:glycoside hydrolase family 47 protein [Ramaria rubella]